MPKTVKPGSKKTTRQPTLTVYQRDRKESLTFEQAFVRAHRMLLRGKVAVALQMIEWLERTQPGDRCVAVLHARAAARSGDFAGCSRLLTAAFRDDERLVDVAGQLHTAVVFRATGLYPSARAELRELCERHPELPSLWLLAGDLWQVVGRRDRAVQSWKEAIRHDYPTKLISKAAGKRIEEATAVAAKPRRAEAKRAGAKRR
ncbi:hypothetical protein Pan44_01290 [Caulifigura coniformis]|uniref:Tetratricopeptide repeat protein n=1 Tax=Caulifigura coniformis TaxID=2527983 RepID=A0A517S7M4_9PLAN|nr:hypothetical protein [Caulifigura coniformis]QDT52120.1 hypothetical protein Pan44_01290 [Caulifigura coniformis]